MVSFARSCWRGCATSGGHQRSVVPTRSLVNNRAAIAQLGERQTEDLKVPSSILGLGISVARGNDDFVPTYSGSRLSCLVLSGI